VGNLATEIADLARRGLSVPQIAERLGVSESRIAAELDAHADAAEGTDSFPASDPPPGPAAT
jgi:IS30 family transposase